MQSDKELMQQALEALQAVYWSARSEAHDTIIAALRERLAQPEHDWEAAYAKQVELHNQTLDELRDALAQPEQEPVCAHGVGKTKCCFCSVKDKQPEQSPLDRMAENARELELDYEPVNTIANSEAIPEQISERCPNCASLEAQNTELDRKLAEMENGEPVGEIVQAFADLTAVSIPVMPPVGTKLYTTPPRREWVGLTEEEVAEMHNEIKVRLMGTYKTEDIYRAIEAKLKKKNS